jgi:fructose-1,6-bisphosphatase I
MAMLLEQAGGKALVAPNARILDVEPRTLHERTPVILGSAAEVDHVVAQLDA